MMTRYPHPLISLSEDLEQLHRQLDRVFEPRALSSEEQPYSLPLELTELENQYKVRAMLPGLHPEDVEVSANHKTLTIEGNCPPPSLEKDERVHLKEFSYGRFRRSITFSTPIVADKIKADYHHGILTLLVPKEEASQRKTVKININP